MKKLWAFQICEYGHFHGKSVHFVHKTRRDDEPVTSPFSYSNAHNLFIFKAIARKLDSPLDVCLLSSFLSSDCVCGYIIGCYKY